MPDHDCMIYCALKHKSQPKNQQIVNDISWKTFTFFFLSNSQNHFSKQLKNYSMGKILRVEEEKSCRASAASDGEKSTKSFSFRKCGGISGKRAECEQRLDLSRRLRKLKHFRFTVHWIPIKFLAFAPSRPHSIGSYIKILRTNLLRRSRNMRGASRERYRNDSNLWARNKSCGK